MRPVLFAALACLALGGCKKKDERKLPQASDAAEVEFTGHWSAGQVSSASVTLVAQLEPCLPVPAKPTRLGEERLTQPGPLFAEFFIKQGTQGYGCLYAKDAAGRVVGAAAFPNNPLTFQGQGEVVFNADLELAPLPPEK